MKITIFTGKHDDPDRVNVVKRAIRVATDHGADLLILPGYSLGATYSDSDELQKWTDKAGIHILAEVGYTYCFRPGQPRLGPFRQRFATSAEAKPVQVQEVLRKFQTKTRIFTVQDKQIGVLLCGENNILRNVLSRDHAAELRDPKSIWPWCTYDVLINPAHTSMGQWNLLHKRFAYFSQHGRTVIHCTNNTHKSWKTALCVYHNGEPVIMGDFKNSHAGQAHIAESWRLLSLDV